MTEKTKKERIEILKNMHNIMMHMNNEEAYFDWVELGVPDYPSEEDYEYIAENNDDFNESFKWFVRCIGKYWEDGLYVIEE